MISAIVVNFNGLAYLPDCLAALHAQDPAPEEVLLVDNASDDGSTAWVAAHYPAVRILDAGDNRGPARARNLGVDAASNETCLLLDNDVVLQPGALATLRAELDGAPETAIVQARSLCGDDPDRVHYDHADLHFLGTLVLHNWFRPLSSATAPSGPVGAAIALCFLTRRSVYRAVGGFDEKMFILYEDNEFSWRVRMCGHDIRLAPEARCLHLGGTVGLSVRSAEAPYPARRTFLHCRNRWFVLGACMRWRTLLFTLPAQLAYAGLYFGFAVSRGHAIAALRGHFAALLAFPAILRRRRPVQSIRVRPDRDLLVALPMTANPGLADRGFKAWLRRTSDRGFALYWRVVRGICG
ncbi:MAG: glycosyltransferase [Planctomycetes bacterium]|nr:glycosyltransferase [Planctomycetota bacterium]